MSRVKEIQKIIAEKITGQYEPCHDSSGHRYLHVPSGIMQRSVTTKLGILSKPHLTKWQIRIAIEFLCVDDRWKRLQEPQWRDELMTAAMLEPLSIRDDSGKVGTIAHNAAERYINDWLASGTRPADITKFAPDNCDPRAIAAMRAVESWFIKEDITPIASEILVGNKYSAGTLDLIFFDRDGKLTLGDFKTSNGIDQNGYAMQVSAYKYMWEAMTKIKISHCKILLLSKDSDKFTVYKINKLPQAYRAFRQICGIYDWVYSPKEKIERDLKKIKI